MYVHCTSLASPPLLFVIFLSSHLYFFFPKFLLLIISSFCSHLPSLTLAVIFLLQFFVFSPVPFCLFHLLSFSMAHFCTSSSGGSDLLRSLVYFKPPYFAGQYISEKGPSHDVQCFILLPILSGYRLIIHNHHAQSAAADVLRSRWRHWGVQVRQSSIQLFWRWTAGLTALQKRWIFIRGLRRFLLLGGITELLRLFRCGLLLHWWRTESTVAFHKSSVLGAWTTLWDKALFSR